MIQKNHKIELVVNGETLELFSQDRLNLRINNTLLDVSEIISKTTEYSFSFELPVTPTNCRIFKFANELSTTGKYNKKYDCIVYADNIEIFNGTLRLASATRDTFKCNLVSVKLNKVEDIFGTTTLSELRWEVPFTGADTINSVNSDMTSDYYFPIVCYGAFQKEPDVQQGDFTRYTDLHQFDSSNVWYWETFHPSIRLNELVRRCFAHKGYEVQGDIFDDDMAKEIFISEQLKDKQDPAYNIGNPDIGDLELSFKFNSKYQPADFPRVISANPWALNQDPTYKHMYLGRSGDTEYYDVEGLYNYDLFSFAPAKDDKPTNFFEWTKYPDNPYLWRGTDDNGRAGYIVVPADGMYAIDIQCDFDITPHTSGNTVPAYLWRRDGSEWKQTEVWLTKNLTNMPIELQLVRNKHDVEWIWGADTNQSVYPHEAGEVRKGEYVRQGHWGGKFVGTADMYTVRDGMTVAYDPMVNSNFICGMSTKANANSYIKNGMSWNLENTDENVSRFNCGGYWKKTVESTTSGSHTTWTQTNYNSNNIMSDSLPYFVRTSDYKASGRLRHIVYLKKNDVLMLKAVTRRFTTYIAEDGSYEFYDDLAFDISVNMKIRPWSPDYEKYSSVNTTAYFDDRTGTTHTVFGSNLNLGNFLKSDEKMSDFIQNYIKAFNLSYRQNGNTVYLNKNKFDLSLDNAIVDIDDRVNSDNAESSRLEYPASIQVKFAIEDSEAGFYGSVPDTHINDNDWKNWADIGSEKIPLVDDETANDESIELKNSYCWYQDFTWLIGTVHPGTITLPVISKDEDFIIQSEKSMKKDGLGLKQRWWFRQQPGVLTVTLWNNTYVYLSIPVNEKDGYVLNYKNEEGSLLRRFFNFFATPDSNMVTIEVSLTPAEYIQLKNGAMVRFDSDLYYVAEISGYDPTCNNLTELHLIKKV